MTTTTNEYAWELFGGYRPIPEWPAYVMSAQLDVWSLPREVPCKGGETRRSGAAKQLKVDEDGRVTLCHAGRKRRFHVERELFPAVFVRPRRQAWCRSEHPLMEPRASLPAILADRIGKPDIALWGTGNRICRRCYKPPETFDTDNAYSLEYGVGGMPEYSTLAAQPKVLGRREVDGDRRQLEELDWTRRGFIISDRPLYSSDEFPQVD